MPHSPDEFSPFRPKDNIENAAEPPPPLPSSNMIPPRGFEDEKFPLRHRLAYACTLGLHNEAANTVFMPIVMNSTDIVNLPSTVQVNPHNSEFEEDGGPLCHPMSIIDKMKISLKLNMTEICNDKQETASGVFSGDGIQSIKCLWRPLFGNFSEKLEATDDDTTTTVAAILGMTHDTTFEDVVPITTTKLAAAGSSDLVQPMSSVYDVQVFGDFNMTTNTAMEDHVWDEALFLQALRRFTNAGALRTFVGRTRHLTLSRRRPFANFFIDKFVPRAIRRIMPFSFFGIQVHLPLAASAEQTYMATSPAGTQHLGIKLIANYHEWNFEHDQNRGTPG